MSKNDVKQAAAEAIENMLSAYGNPHPDARMVARVAEEWNADADEVWDEVERQLEGDAG